MPDSQPLRIAVAGCGFWARFQVAAWQELRQAQIVAVCDPDVARADAIRAAVGGEARAYPDVRTMLRRERVDALDVITPVTTHADVVRAAIEREVPVICQKPLAPTLAEAEALVAEARAAGVPFLVHENWRWQSPIRALKQVLERAEIGDVFRARIDFVTGFPVFANQPFLRELQQFIITDIGSHLLDAARFLFGPIVSVYCQTRRVHGDIRGEDVATVTMRSAAGAIITCNMAYAENYLERDVFPETLIFVEAEHGSAELAADYQVRVTTRRGTHAVRHPPRQYAWADPAYALVQASIVPCNADLLNHLTGRGQAETTAEDNLQTVRLVFAVYESAATDSVVAIDTRSAEPKPRATAGTWT